MAALPVISNNVMPSGGQGLAEGLVTAINSQAKTLLELKDSSLGILRATLSMKDTLESNASAANLDSSTVQGNVEKKKDDGLAGKFGDMLESMQDAFDGMSTGKKSLLGIAALLGGLALLNTFSDELVELIAPILKFFNETLLPNLKELNQIILAQPGGYLTLLGAAGLTKTMFDIFGKGGKIAKVIDDTADGIKVLKQVDLLDDLAIRKVSWTTRLRTAFTGRMTGLFTRIGRIFTSIGSTLRGLGVALLDDVAAGLKTLTPTWAKVLKLQLVGGETIYPIVKGGGKQVGIVGKVSQGIQKIVASIKGLNPFKGLSLSLKTLTPTWAKVLKLQMLGGETIYPIVKGGGKQVGVVGKASQAIQKIVASIKNLNPFKNTGTALKTIGSSWKAALTGSLFGTAGGPAGGGRQVGVLTKVTNAIAKIATVVRGIFSPTSMLGKFTSKIRSIFAIIGKALGFVSKLSGLTSFLKLGLSLGKAIPVVGQIIMVLTGIFGFIKGAITGFKTGGILGAITGGLIGLYDGLIGSFVNLIADVLGWIFTKLGFKKFGAFLSGLDFSFAGLMNGLSWVWDKIKYAMWAIGDGIKAVANGVLAGASALTLGIYKPDYIDRPPFVSTYTPMTEPDAPALPDMPDAPEAAKVTRVKIDDFNANDLTKVDYGNAMDGVSGPEFADIPEIILSDSEVKAKEAALIAASQMTDDGTGDALILAINKKQALEDEKFLKQIEQGGGSIVMSDTSSKTQLNNTTVVSNSLAVDASDLIASKLNMMLA